MIFKQIDAIRRGVKTQTRREVKAGDTFRENHLCKIVGVYRSGRLLWKVGGVYAIVPKRGMKGIGKIRILEIRRERLQDISEADAIAEGVEFEAPFYSVFVGGKRLVFGVSAVEAYRELWESINGRGSWDKNPYVWVICFEVVEMVEDTLSEVETPHPLTPSPTRGEGKGSKCPECGTVDCLVVDMINGDKTLEAIYECPKCGEIFQEVVRRA